MRISEIASTLLGINSTQACIYCMRSGRRLVRSRIEDSLSVYVREDQGKCNLLILSGLGMYVGCERWCMWIKPICYNNLLVKLSIAVA